VFKFYMMSDYFYALSSGVDPNKRVETLFYSILAYHISEMFAISGVFGKL
jgi:hypothetical protein